MRRTTRRRRGMSLVEVMVVIAIILTMMAVLGWGVMRSYQDACVSTTEIAMTKVGESVEMFTLRKKRLPDQIEFAKLAADAVDGWGQPFEFRVPGEDAPYSVVSLGRDGVEGGTDHDEDLVWSPEGSRQR